MLLARLRHDAAASLTPTARHGHRSIVHRPAGGQVRPAGHRLARPGEARHRSRRDGARRSETRSRRAMLEEVRISGLGVIDEAVLELSPGFNVVTGETGAGKTMVVSGLGLLFGGRADPSRIRPGADRATVEGRLRTDPDGEVAKQVNDAGGDLDDDGATLVLVRSVSAEGPVARLRRRAVGAGLAADLPVRRSRRRARSGRSAAAAEGRQAAPGARPVRRGRAQPRAQRLPARVQPAPQGRRGAGRADLAGPRARARRPRTCGRA